MLLGGNLALMLIAASFIPQDVFGEEAYQDSIVVENKISLTTKIVVQYPVKKVKITQGYRAFHPGLDLDGSTGDKIYPIKDGTIELISNSRYAYGKAILVNHGEGISSLYAHLSKINVSEGEVVNTSTIIGEMGATGRANGDHLHLEIRKNGVPVNPYTILPKN
jgi:murein DD-endopeptidase MepM/ murein hydrolase activator NlpD